MTRLVTIVGAGPAGLTAARVLRKAGIRDVLVLERNPQPGGLPRFCGHVGWGLLDFRRVWTGPTYARRLVEAAGDVDIRVDHSVIALHPDGDIEVNGPGGTERIRSRTVLVTTGIREKPRSARLVSGTRPWGVVSTGALQEMVYEGKMRPFRRPVVMGTELVSFSAVLTSRHAGIRPIAMIEAGSRITARRPGDWIARGIFGVPILTNTRLVRIEGVDRVTGVVVERAGREEAIACDGVVLTGQFVPESALVRAGHLALDPATGGPSIDDAWRCSDRSYFAAGNLLRPVEHSGAAAREGELAARAILKALDDRETTASSTPTHLTVQPGHGLSYVYPQRLLPEGGAITLFARASAEHHGRIRATAGDRMLAERRIHILPERRLTFRLPASVRSETGDLRVDLVP